MTEIPMNEIFELVAISHTGYNREIHDNDKSKHLLFNVKEKRGEKPLEYRIKEVSSKGKVLYNSVRPF